MTYREYKNKVLAVTKRQPIYLLENFIKRGRSGIEGSYHLDHIYSIKQGYVNNIPEEVIGGIKNLRFIPYKDNLKKSQTLTNESWDMFVYFIKEEIL